jgi:phage gpG-like protein
MNVSITLTPQAEALIRRFKPSPELGQAMALRMDKENQLSVDAIKAKLSGPVLNRVTGRLRDSIGRTQSIISGDNTSLEIRSAVGSGTGQGAEAVRYAAIHEFGGTIVPKDPSGYLKFRTSAGNFVSVKKVVIPERSYLRSTISERTEQYSRRMSKTVVNFFKGADNV